METIEVVASYVDLCRKHKVGYWTSAKESRISVYAPPPSLPCLETRCQYAWGFYRTAKVALGNGYRGKNFYRLVSGLAEIMTGFYHASQDIMGEIF